MTDKETREFTLYTKSTLFYLVMFGLMFIMVILIVSLTDNTSALESNFQAQKILIEQNQSILSSHEMMK